MKIIILGYNSFVGSAIAEYFDNKDNVELVYVGRKDCDQHDVIKFDVKNNLSELKDNVADLVKTINLDYDSVVVNCISMGDVDKCETHKEECEIQNYEFVKILYDEMSKGDFSKLVHFSTNAVYDGKHAPYGETSECHPVNYYGVIKLKADHYLLDQKDNRVIVARPITMYGKVPEGGRANPTSMIIGRLMANQELKLVNDVLVNILYIGDLVRTVEKLLEIDFSGLINISGDEIYSRYDLGLKIAGLLNKDPVLIESVTSDEFVTVAKRPLDTSFDNALMKQLGIKPSLLADIVPGLL